MIGQCYFCPHRQPRREPCGLPKLNRPRYHPRARISILFHGSKVPSNLRPSTSQAGPQLSGLLTLLMSNPDPPRLATRSRSARRVFPLKVSPWGLTTAADHRGVRRKGEHPLLFLVHLILVRPRGRDNPCAERTQNQPLCILYSVCYVHSTLGIPHSGFCTRLRGCLAIHMSASSHLPYHPTIPQPTWWGQILPPPFPCGNPTAAGQPAARKGPAEYVDAGRSRRPALVPIPSSHLYFARLRSAPTWHGGRLGRWRVVVDWSWVAAGLG